MRTKIKPFQDIIKKVLSHGIITLLNVNFEKCSLLLPRFKLKSRSFKIKGPSTFFDP